jgi:hypothetical protein
MRRTLIVLLSLATFWQLPAASQAPEGRGSAGRRIVTARPGPQKLQIDLALAAAAGRFTVDTGSGDSRARGGLGDFRIFDAGGREVPYLLIDPPGGQPRWLTGSLLPVAATANASGFELDLGGVRTVDALAIAGLQPPYMKRLLLEGSGDRARWTVLVREATVFDLPAERVRQTTVEFVPGAYRYLRVRWDDRSSGRLPLPLATAREHRGADAAQPVIAAVPFAPQAGEPGRSRYRITLPAASLPIAALVLDVGDGDVFRTAVVLESRFARDQGSTTPAGSGTRRLVAAPGELGRARLAQSGTPGVERPPLRLPVAHPVGSELQLVIEDGGNPPLRLESVSVELATLPWIFFEAPEGQLTARYANPAAPPPRYDIEARRASIRLEALPEASWADPGSAAAAAQAPPAPAPNANRGGVLDVSGFRYTRALDLPAAGLVSLQLDPAVLAHSAGVDREFADVRIVDASRAQVPYLLERRDEPLSLDLSLAADSEAAALLPSSPGARSVYAIDLPHEGLPPGRLVLETSDRVFRRAVEIGVERAPDRQHRDRWFQRLAATTWQHADDVSASPALDLAVAVSQGTRLLVVVEEGDNRPLAITAARLLLPSWRVRFFADGAPLDLVYGNPGASAPQYDLALLAPAVLGADARDVTAAPDRGERRDAPFLSPRLFWIGLGLAALALLGLLVRLISSGTPPRPSPPAP